MQFERNLEISLNSLAGFSFAWNSNEELNFFHRFKHALKSFFCGVTVQIHDGELLCKNHSQSYCCKFICNNHKEFYKNITSRLVKENKVIPMRLPISSSKLDHDVGDIIHDDDNSAKEAKTNDTILNETIDNDGMPDNKLHVDSFGNSGKGQKKATPGDGSRVLADDNKSSTDEENKAIENTNNKTDNSAYLLEELEYEQCIYNDYKLNELKKEHLMIEQPEHLNMMLRPLYCKHMPAKNKKKSDSDFDSSLDSDVGNKHDIPSENTLPCLCESDIKYQPDEHEDPLLKSFIDSFGSKAFMQSNNLWCCSDSTNNLQYVNVMKGYFLHGAGNKVIEENLVSPSLCLANNKGALPFAVRLNEKPLRTVMEVTLPKNMLIIHTVDAIYPKSSFFIWIANHYKNEIVKEKLEKLKETEEVEYQKKKEDASFLNSMKDDSEDEAINRANTYFNKLLEGNRYKGVVLLTHKYRNFNDNRDSGYTGEITKSNIGEIKNFKLFDSKYNTKVSLRLTDKEIKDNGLIGKKVSLTTHKKELQPLNVDCLVYNSFDDLNPKTETIYKLKVELTVNQKMLRRRQYETKYYIYNQDKDSYIRVKPDLDASYKFNNKFYIQYSRPNK